jgi:hypothetical protein
VDSGMKRTKAIEDNWVPVWEEEFTFHLTVPEIALLRVEVHEYDMSEKDDWRTDRAAGVGAATRDPGGGALRPQREQVEQRQASHAL